MIQFRFISDFSRQSGCTGKMAMDLSVNTGLPLVTAMSRDHKPGLSLDLRVHHMDRDNNNDIRVVDLSVGKDDSKEEEEDDPKIQRHGADRDIAPDSEKLRSLLPHLDITALNILCLARLQVTTFWKI